MLTSLVSLWRENVKISKKHWWKQLILTGKSLHIFWTPWRTSIKFSRNMWLMIILKLIKNQGYTVSLENTFFEKPQEEGDSSNWPRKPFKSYRVFTIKLTRLLLYIATIFKLHSNKCPDNFYPVSLLFCW